jgi:hypothetical protein
MEKEFVPYELALRMKQLGFNEPCFGMYQKNKKLWYCSKNNWITNFEANPDPKTLDLHIKEYPKNVSLINGTYFLHSCSNFTAPTFSQAFRWFREKYDLWSCIQKYPTSENPNRCYYELKGDNINTDKDESPNSYMSGWFNSYDEAELACLTRLIKIVEKELIN